MSTAHTVAMVVRLSLCGPRRAKLQGRCFDLKSAYRQIPVRASASHLHSTAVAVFNPHTQRPAVLRILALPFGAGASVPAFVCVSVALWRILVEQALVPCTMFFDDFRSTTWEHDCWSVDSTVHLLFRALGWRLACEGAKATPFVSEFQSLGSCSPYPLVGIGACWLAIQNPAGRRSRSGACAHWWPGVWQALWSGPGDSVAGLAGGAPVSAS